MLFYASLLLLCLALSALTVWLYRSVISVGKQVYRAFLPSSKGNIREEKPTKLSSSLDTALTPWGWSVSRGRRARRQPVMLEPDPAYAGPIPWGWPGNRHQSKVPVRKTIRGPRFEPVQEFLSDRAEPAKTGTEGADMADVGWPYRDESFEFAGRQYRVKRGPKISTTNGGGPVRPWGW